MKNIKSQFPLFTAHPDLIYLDSAATTQKPSCVIDAMSRFYQTGYATVHRAIYRLSKNATQAYVESKESVKQFINAQFEAEIVFTRGATSSINLLANSLKKSFLKDGDLICVPEIEHHSNLIPWQMACSEIGAQLIKLPVNDRGELEIDALERTLKTGKVKLISLAHVSNVIGTLHPIEEVVQLARRYGSLVCVDGAQSAGHMPINVQKLDIDFFVCSGHKLYGPTGIGILYGKKALLDQLPPVEGGGDMVATFDWESSIYQEVPLKFEAGTPMVAEAVGLKAALQFISEIGLENISQYEKQLSTKMIEGLKQIDGFEMIGNPIKQGSLFSFNVSGVHPMDLAALLDCHQIAIRTGHQCSQSAMKRFDINAAARISFGVYNQEREIRFFIEKLKEALNLLR